VIQGAEPRGSGNNRRPGETVREFFARCTGVAQAQRELAMEELAEGVIQ
jgi:hypothetical protein